MYNNPAISKASADQRTGRTGRVFAGISVRLFPRPFFEQHMSQFEKPIINIAPLENTVLQVMSLAQQSTMFVA